MVVFLRHLTVEDYGPFSKLDIDLGDITIFVGRNNTGKSTALEAIVLLLSSIDSSRMTDVLSKLSYKGRYLINLRSSKETATISGNIYSQGITNRVEVRITSDISKLGEYRNNVIPEIMRLAIELSPRSQEILIEAFRRIQKENRNVKDFSEAFGKFVDEVVTTLSDYVNDLLSSIMLMYVYIDDKLISIASLPLMSEVKFSENIVNRLMRLGLSSIEARRLLNNQLGRILESRVIPINVNKVNMKPINVQYLNAQRLSTYSFPIDTLSPGRQTEFIDLLRSEVRYFYDYRGGHVILNFDGNKVDVPYSLMGDGFKALVRMLGLIVMGVDVAVIDEPEAHLHPGFMELIVKYMVEPRFLDRMQFIMATQSLEFLDYLLNAARDRGVLDRVRLIRLYLMPDGSIDYEQLSGEDAYGERHKLESDLRGP
ncbi:MAG: ATP-binding protein [Vulcanisaeta sp.]|uniref:ATP-binding protein n=1 Tax=Vulcanisaeta sp. TaxID=2020871 RepID=UPI003D0C0233